MKRVLFLCDRPLGLRCLDFVFKQGIPLCGVVSRPDGEEHWWGRSAFQAYCLENRLPWYHYSIPLRPVVEETKPDVLLSVLFPRIVEEAIFSRVEGFNLHCAPLPRYKGFNSTLWAILNGEKTFGATLHRMARQPDEGEIVAQGTFQIPDHATNLVLYQMAHEEGYRLFCENLIPLLEGTHRVTPQVGEGRFYGKDEIPSREMDLRWPAEKIAAYARAFYFPPFEPAYFVLNGLKMHLIPGPGPSGGANFSTSPAAGRKKIPTPSG